MRAARARRGARPRLLGETALGLPLDADGILCRQPGYVPRQGTHDGRRVAARPRNGGDMPPVREQVEELVHSPVFVDPSGRRRTWVTCALAAAAVVCVGYVVLLAFSLMGGPLPPRRLPSLAPRPRS